MWNIASHFILNYLPEVFQTSLAAWVVVYSYEFLKRIFFFPLPNTKAKTIWFLNHAIFQGRCTFIHHYTYDIALRGPRFIWCRVWEKFVSLRQTYVFLCLLHRLGSHQNKRLTSPQKIKKNPAFGFVFLLFFISLTYFIY